MPGIKCGNCHERHATVDQVRDCHQHPVSSQPAPSSAASQETGPAPSVAQMQFIASLAARKGVDAPEPTTRKGASFAIDQLKALPEAQSAAKTEDELKSEVGVYVLPDGRIVQVKPNKAKTRVYGKLWVNINGERLTLSDEHVKGEWDYKPGLLSLVKPEYRMTLEQAKRFILVYGQCCRCGRKLKAAKSVEQGIGPVCIKYFGGEAFAA